MIFIEVEYTISKYNQLEKRENITKIKSQETQQKFYSSKCKGLKHVQRQSPRGTHKAVCWCGLSLGSEEHADPFAGRKDQESPRLGASGGLGDVQVKHFVSNVLS